MKRIAALFLILGLTLCSCNAQNQYFSVSGNKVTRVHSTPAQSDDAVYKDAFDLYRNPGMASAQFGTKIFFFYTDDPYEPDYPRLMYIDISNTVSPAAYPVCTDPSCIHNNENPSVHCIFADLVSYESMVCSGEYIYFSAFDRSYYNTVTERIEFYPATPPHEYYGETECPCRLIKYNVVTGAYSVLYDAPAGEYIDDIFIYNRTLYFTLTHYVERPNLIYSHDDGEYFYFRDLKNADNPVKRPVKPFYTNLTERRFRDGETNAFGEEIYFTDVYLHNIRYNRMYMIVNNILWEKVYSLMTMDLNGGSLNTLVEEIGASDATRSSLKRNESGAHEEFGEFFIIEGRAYYTLSDGLYTQEKDFPYPAKDGSQAPVKLINFDSPANRNFYFSSFQYDQYTHNLYYLAGKEGYGAELRKIKALGYGSRAEITVYYFNGNINSYQATIDGIYFTLCNDSTEDRAGSLYFVRWLQINDIGNTAYTIINGEDTGLYVLYPSVIGDYIITINRREEEYTRYSLCLITCKISVDKESASDAEPPPINTEISIRTLITG